MRLPIKKITFFLFAGSLKSLNCKALRERFQLFYSHSRPAIHTLPKLFKLCLKYPDKIAPKDFVNVLLGVAPFNQLAGDQRVFRHICQSHRGNGDAVKICSQAYMIYSCQFYDIFHLVKNQVKGYLQGIQLGLVFFGQGSTLRQVFSSCFFEGIFFCPLFPYDCCDFSAGSRITVPRRPSAWRAPAPAPERCR